MVAFVNANRNGWMGLTNGARFFFCCSVKWDVGSFTNSYERNTYFFLGSVIYPLYPNSVHENAHRCELYGHQSDHRKYAHVDCGFIENEHEKNQQKVHDCIIHRAKLEHAMPHKRKKEQQEARYAMKYEQPDQSNLQHPRPEK